MSIAILVPTRGRPDRFRAMAESALTNVSGDGVGIVVIPIVDPDDPQLAAYQFAGPKVLDERVGFTGSLNRVAPTVWNEYSILGAFGDDVIFRTPGWDRIVEETLATPGIAYGDDLIHGVNHPSAVFMSSAIAQALGWLGMPLTKHQWADDAWKRLGQELGCLRYMPDVIVEHMHPAVNKAPMDATYGWNLDGSDEANDRAKADFEAFEFWQREGLPLDVERVRAALARVP